MVTLKEKQELKNKIVASLKGEKDIRKVVIFGSFLHSDNPRDIDVAVFQESGYYSRRKGEMHIHLVQMSFLNLWQ